MPISTVFPPASAPAPSVLTALVNGCRLEPTYHTICDCAMMTSWRRDDGDR